MSNMQLQSFSYWSKITAILLNIWLPADSVPVGWQSYLTETGNPENFTTLLPTKAFVKYS